MKVAGKSYTPPSKAITVVTTGGTEVPLLVSAYPSGFNEVEGTLFPEPKPPKTFVYDGRGKIMRDGGKPVIEDDSSDAKYQNSMLSMVKMRQARRFHAALRNDPEVEWETKVPDGTQLETLSNPDAREFFAGVFEEAECGGFGLAQMASVVEIAAQLSGMMATEARGSAEASFRVTDERD